MATKREQIFQAIFAKLQAIPGVTAARNRDAAATLEEGVVVVLYGRWNDTPTQNNYGDPTDWQLIFGVRILAAGSNVPAAVDTAAGLVHAAIMTEPTQGGLCDQTIPRPQTSLTADANGMVSAQLDMAYEARYSTSLPDLSA